MLILARTHIILYDSVNGACVVYRHVNSDICRKLMCFSRFSSVLEPYYTCLTRLFKNLFMILGIPVIKVESIKLKVNMPLIRLMNLKDIGIS